jgi:signal transduction histidine kinase
MAGPGTAGRRARPTPVATLLRAAVAEAEAGHDQDDTATRARRVELVASDEVEVDGRAGTDLVHLVAELIDNAAAFSPPAAPVVVTGAVDGDGYRIEVTDRGLGMTGQELARANQRLAGDAAPRWPTPTPATGSAC